MLDMQCLCADETRTLSRQGTSTSSRWRDIANMGPAADLRDPSPVKRADDSGPVPLLQVPQRPFGSGLENLPAAYKRAGLGFWATDSAPEVEPCCCILKVTIPPRCHRMSPAGTPQCMRYHCVSRACS